MQTASVVNAATYSLPATHAAKDLANCLASCEQRMERTRLIELERGLAVAMHDLFWTAPRSRLQAWKHGLDWASATQIRPPFCPLALRERIEIHQANNREGGEVRCTMRS